jgi:hypothetical protein
MMPKHIEVAADHGGSELKEYLVRMLREVGYEVTDLGDHHPTLDDDYPDFVVPLGRAVAGGEPKVRLEQDVKEARWILERLPELGVSIDNVTQQIEDEGVEKFNKPFDTLMRPWRKCHHGR